MTTRDTFSTNGTTHGASSTDADLDLLYSWVAAPSAPPTAAPEALFSLTLHGRLDGIDAMLTVRGMTVAAFQANLQAVRGLLDQPAPPAASQGQGEGWCRQHGLQMTLNDKHGRQWYSHKTGFQERAPENLR